MSEPLLTFQHITICAGNEPLATDISFTLQEGEILVIAGESGSGKSTLLRAAAGLPAPGTGITGGIITWDGHRLHHQSSWKALRPTGISVVFQDALTSFCPVCTVYQQLWDAARTAGLCHQEFDRILSGRAALLSLPPDSLSSYPQELSGGMIQRAELLFPLIIPPRLVLADEPTSAVDSITQKKMADALLRLRRHHRTAIILVTHDLRLAAYLADTLLVLKKGRIQEYGPAPAVLKHPGSAYTRELLSHSGL